MARLDFSRRADLSESPELMDGDCSYEELRGCLRDLAWVNRLTFAQRPVMEWLNRLISSPQRSPHSPLRIVDVGCGYGDMLRRIEGWAKRRGVAVELTGIDLNANAVRAAREATPAGSRIAWVAGDAFSLEAEPDVVLSSLVTHHLEEAEIVRFLNWMEGAARMGWFVCDLHRKPMPYRIFRVAMKLGWWHPFIRPDGLTSIRRSFVPEDWRRMCAVARLDAGAVEIREYRPARLCVGRVK